MSSFKQWVSSSIQFVYVACNGNAWIFKILSVVFSMVSVAKIGSQINMHCLDMHDEQANTCSCFLSSSYQASFVLITLPYNFTDRLYKRVFKDFSKVIFTMAAQYKSLFMKCKNDCFWNTLLNICSMNYGLKNIHLANTYSWSVMYIINVWYSLIF